MCTNPINVIYKLDASGKMQIKFSSENQRLFLQNSSHFSLSENMLQLPCQKCYECRLERSRQWATRIMHESQMHSQNCFLTLTFDDDHLRSECALELGGYSLNRRHPQLFLKRLRQAVKSKLRVFYCGEYGDKTGRPHYHFCLFGFYPRDAVYLKTVRGNNYYTSEFIRKFWSFGNNIVGDLTFDSAAYVARYVMKKVGGSLAEAHYLGRLPEFAQASLKPGIGSAWLDKFGYSDIFNRDECIVNGVVTKAPRYYDKYLEKRDPVLYQSIKERRAARHAARDQSEFTHARNVVRHQCIEIKMKQLKRGFDD